MKNFILSISALCILQTVDSQINTVVIGENAYGSNGNISYSVGQIDFISFSGTNSNVNQGVQQPFEFFSVLGIEEIEVPFTIKFGPNPTNNQVILSVIDYNKNDFEYSVSNWDGKTIIEKTALHGTSTLNFENYSSGTYLLYITDNQNQIKTYKILKN